jgi:hypothetical protein
MGQHVWHRNCMASMGGEWGAPPHRKWSGGAFLRFQPLSFIGKCSMMQHLAKDDASDVLVGSNPGSPRLALSKFEWPGSSIGGLSAGRRAKTASVLKRRRCAG